MQIEQLPHSSWSRGGDQVWYTVVFTALSVVICAWTYYLLIIIATQFSVVGFPLEVRTYPFNICCSTPTSLKKAKRRTVNIHGTCTWERERERERETETETEREVSTEKIRIISSMTSLPEKSRLTTLASEDAGQHRTERRVYCCYPRQFSFGLVTVFI